ncbi:hypothetical protein WJX73_006683 [Symbiochloris irregularis]|uniref:Uncharacterized protein n=1 Tax=Symbiochloris irregularis TaxID=706552 RepID=A0AAW1PQK8_9CHLO
MFEEARSTEEPAGADAGVGADAPASSIQLPVAQGRKSLADVRRARNSDAAAAYDRGRKSGVWQGRTQQQMQQLEESWDGYKAFSVRGWSIPTMEDVQAKSRSLVESGFTFALPLQPLNRALPSSPAPSSGAPQRSISARDLKRKGPGVTQQDDSSKGMSGSPAKRSRSNIPTPQRSMLGRSKDGGSKQVHSGAAASISSKPSQIPSAPHTHSQQAASNVPHVNRAKKAEEAFAARRAAALGRAGQK